MANRREAPNATYRLQLTPDFTFDDAAQLTPYLGALGISHLYLSPVFEAVPGSQHGYDVTDPTRFRGELGDQSAFYRLSDAAQSAGMEIIVDIVPNHMSASHHNPWWRDVLRNGESSERSKVFDISWGERSDRKLALPALGGELEDLVRSGEITLEESGGALELAYYDARFPLSPESEAEAPKSPPSGPDDLLRLARSQNYSLEYWRAGIERLNYRRFFDISDLVGVRVEDREVFELTHRLLRDEVLAGRISGVRVDHIDGLRDPAGYLQWLREYLAPAGNGDEGGPLVYVEKILASFEELRYDWDADGTTGYEFANAVNGVFVDIAGLEKLKRLHARHTDSSSSYAEDEWQAKLDVIDRLFQPELMRLASMLSDIAASDGATLDSSDCAAAVRALTARMHVYRTYAGQSRSERETESHFHETLAEAERDLANGPGGREALNAFGLLKSIALGEDVKEETQPLHDELMARWRQLTGAVMAKGVEDTTFYRHTPLVSLNEVGGDPVGETSSPGAFHGLNSRRSQGRLYSMNATSSHDTKRSEDTRARINVLSELAAEWRDEVERWTDINAGLAHASGDTRSPSAQAESLFYQSLLGIWPVGSTADSLDAIADRLAGYMVKAAREAKLETSWLDPDAAYEEGLRKFVNETVSGVGGERFRERFAPFAERVAFHGAVNSLTQVVLKAASPGFPDFYQGSETWDFSLVDPDNRRPVGFTGLTAQLDRLTYGAARSGVDTAEFVRQLFHRWQTGEVKQWVTYMALQTRKALPGVFSDGDYMTLEATGPHAESFCGFTRASEDASIIAVGTRLSTRLGSAPSEICGLTAWEETELPLHNDRETNWTDALTGAQVISTSGRLRLSDVFDKLPVALLIPGTVRIGGSE